MNITRTIHQSKSAEIVASIDDLLIDILLRLPIRSLIRFKLVSKQWLSLVTTPKFSLLRTPNHNPAIGLFLPCPAFRVNPSFEYIRFDTENQRNPPFQKLEFNNDPSRLRILQSCNGLLLCSSSRARESNHKYYIYNPTTKHFTTLPDIGSGTSIPITISGINLAFDPSRSPHYKVVCIWSSDLIPSGYQIKIYSSETGPWRISGEPFSTRVSFATGVYWNGSIHWTNTWGNQTSLRYDIEHETLCTMPMPPVPDGMEDGRIVAYFGESCDHLHLIERYDPGVQFNIYEMKSDYSGWFVKYHVDLGLVTFAFPDMIRTDRDSRDWLYYAFSIFTLVRGVIDEDSFLVLQIPNKAIRYNLESKTFEELCWDTDGAEIGGYLPFQERKAVEYIESLCCV